MKYIFQKEQSPKLKRALVHLLTQCEFLLADSPRRWKARSRRRNKQNYAQLRPEDGAGRVQSLVLQRKILLQSHTPKGR